MTSVKSSIQGVSALRQNLREWRTKTSKDLEIPPYRILTNKSIEALIETRPQSKGELLAVHGIGPVSVNLYGTAILALTRKQLQSSSELPGLPDLERLSIEPARSIQNTVILSKKQEAALEAFLAGDNVFITGPGGTGKSALIKKVFQAAEARGRRVQACAMTGCAAVLLGSSKARTLHSWAGIGLGTAAGGPEAIIEKVRRDRYKSQAWRETDVLILDEVSMLSRKLFEILDQLGRVTRRNIMKPFGGMQLFFSGDFYQLPPVTDESSANDFCFESGRWSSTFTKTFVFDQIFRQNDARYIKILNQIRRGRLSRRSYDLLKDRLNRSIPAEKSHIRPTILTPRRTEANSINRDKLDILLQSGAESKTFRLERVTRNQKGEQTESHPSFVAQEHKALEKAIRADSNLKLAVGAQVMCVVNIANHHSSDQPPIVNGSQGVVQCFSASGNPVVDFGSTTREITPHAWCSHVDEAVGVKQIPLILAWAITIHKAQGLSLELAQIDAGSGVFECGQTYVALSRVKNLDGLFLSGLDPAKITVNKRVKAYYDSLAEGESS